MSKQPFCRLFLFVILFMSFHFLQAQNNVGNDRYAPIRLQLDKKYFLPGETVFFNAMYLSADTIPGRSCTVVLVDEHKKILQSKELLFADYMAGSYFLLPAGDSAAYYCIEYYINSSTEPVIYSKYIFSALSGAALQAPLAPEPVVDVVPEGGELVAGLPAVLYCKFTGLPLSAFPLQATVTASSGDTLADFMTTPQGAGRIELSEVPEGKIYIHYQFAEKSYTEPLVLNFSKKHKAILNLYPADGSVVYRVRTLVSDSFFVKVESDGAVYYYVSVYLNEGDDFARPLKLSQLKPGVSIFHLLDGSGKEICSSSTFIQLPEEERVNVQSIDRIKDEGLKLKLDKKLSGIFSIGARRVKNDDSIHTVPPGEERSLDNTNLLADRNSHKALVPRSTDGLYITLKDDNNNLVKNADITVMIRSGGDNFISQKSTDDNGELLFKLITVSDSAVLGFFRKDKTGPNSSVAGTYHLEKIFTDPSLYVPAPALMAAAVEEPDPTALSLDMFKTKTLKEIVLKNRSRYRSKVDSVEQAYASGMFISGVHNVARFDLINEYQGASFGDVASFLSGRIIKMNTASNGMSTSMDGYFIYLDENLVDAVMARNIQMSDVAFISITDRNFLTMNSFGPAVLIYTKKGKSIEQSSDNTAFKKNSLKIKGFASPTAYFNPLFDNRQVDDRYRTTLFWDSKIQLNNTDEIMLPLLADPKCKIEISVEGFNNNGDFVTLNTMYDLGAPTAH